MEATMDQVPPDRAVTRRRGLLGWLVALSSAAGTFGIVLLMLFINADVLSRNLLGQPVRGVPEVVSIGIVGIVFLQVAQCLAAGRMTRSDMLLRRLERRSVRAARALDAFFHVVGAALFLIIAWFGRPFAVDAWRQGDYVGVVGIFTFPAWPVAWSVVLGSVLVAVQYLRIAGGLARQAAGRTAAIRTGEAP